MITDKTTRIKILLNELTDAERLEIFDSYCVDCGSTDDICNCYLDA